VHTLFLVKQKGFVASLNVRLDQNGRVYGVVRSRGRLVFAEELTDEHALDFAAFSGAAAFSILSMAVRRDSGSGPARRFSPKEW
jgi:hypothetical protein